MRRSQYLPLDAAPIEALHDQHLGAEFADLTTGDQTLNARRCARIICPLLRCASACRLPTRPSGSLKMCVVGVEPWGGTTALCLRNAVFSWAPAIDAEVLVAGG
jgi:hypothetical protein